MPSDPTTDHLDDWKTQEEAAEILRCSKKTISRMAEQGKIQRVLRRVPGRKPMPVFNPSDIEAQASETVNIQPFPVPRHVEKKALAPQARSRESAMLMQLLMDRAATTLNTSPRHKVFLTLKEAADYSGMPRAWLLQKIRKEELPAIKAGGWRIRRADIEQL